MDAASQAPQTAKPEDAKDQVIPATFIRINHSGNTVHILSNQKKVVGNMSFPRTMCGLVVHRSSLYLPPTSKLPDQLCIVCGKRSNLIKEVNE